MKIVIRGKNESFEINMPHLSATIRHLLDITLGIKADNKMFWNVIAYETRGRTQKNARPSLGNLKLIIEAMNLPTPLLEVHIEAWNIAMRLEIDKRIKELVATRRMQATNPPDNPAKQTEQSCSQPKGTDTMSQVNASIPVQTITYVYGYNIDHMGKSELFNAARAVAAEIEGLKKANESVGSVAIEQQIVGLEKDLNNIRGLLDSKYATQTTETAAE